ncbi:hypothetical protein [Legionella sp. 29fVS95]|uniref:hypothetical protein n=1 Tax=Legionella sp. 29fVS95 TaxID=3402813 RepID=UPI003AF9693F
MFYRILFLLTIPFLSFADPAPFGLEINKTKLPEARKLYSLALASKNKESKTETYQVDTRKINFKGLLSLQATFNEKGILAAVHGTMEKTNFERMLTTLDNKYELITKQVPPAGNKEAKLKDHNTIIFIEAPHLSTQMAFLYMNEQIWNKALATIAKNGKNQKLQEKRQV